MPNMFWAWVLIPIVAIIAGVAGTWIRVAHGYPPDAGRRRGRGEWQMPGGAAEGEPLREALKKSDARIAALEERVRVLERIATDNSARLRDEIDKLR